MTIAKISLQCILKHQSHKMVKHSQTIRQLLTTNFLDVFDHLVGLVRKGLNKKFHLRISKHFLFKPLKRQPHKTFIIISFTIYFPSSNLFLLLVFSPIESVRQKKIFQCFISIDSVQQMQFFSHSSSRRYNSKRKFKLIENTHCLFCYRTQVFFKRKQEYLIWFGLIIHNGRSIFVLGF